MRIELEVILNSQVDKILCFSKSSDSKGSYFYDTPIINSAKSRYIYVFFVLVLCNQVNMMLVMLL